MTPAPLEVRSTTALEQEKQLATLRARLALKGITLVDSQDDRGRPEWIATWHAMTKAFGDLSALAAWADRVEGKAG